MPRSSSQQPEVRPLSARSAVLSLLLGAHPPSLPVRDLVRAARLLHISESALRVALTRMVAAGDLVREDTTYCLSDRLLARQQRQDERLDLPQHAWHDRWRLVMVTAVGRSAAERLQLRTQLHEAHLAELREGVWLRPDNLQLALAESDGTWTTCFTGMPEGDPRLLAEQLWDLPGWANTGRQLVDLLQSAPDPARQLAVAAATLRQLLIDPILPPELLPGGWPSSELRAAYTAYRSKFAELVQPANGTPPPRVDQWEPTDEGGIDARSPRPPGAPTRARAATGADLGA